MELTGQKKVHIVPMGFEIDRIELPLRDIGADRVYLVADEKEVTKIGYARAKRQYFEKLQDHGGVVKKGKGRSSYIEITEEGKNTFETFMKVAALESKPLSQKT